MIFGELRTGSNFNDDDRTTAGVNGLGSKLTSIFSTEFKVETADGKNRFVQSFRNNTRDRGTAVIQPSKDNGTTITFIPDYSRLDCELDEPNIKKIERRVYDVAGCNPGINVFLYGKKIDIKSFKDYVELFTEEYVFDETDDYSIALSARDDSQFKHVSFVNGIDTYNGGTHIDYVMWGIVNKLRELIKKKHKIDVKPNTIRQQMFLIMKCRVNAPAFNSQTKEFMCSEARDFGTSYTPNDKFIKKLFESPVVEKVLDWVNAEKRKEELAELRKLNKQTQNNNFLKRITKFDDATGKDRSKCILVLTEGDSAATTILSARDPETIGVFPLRGKFINVRDIEVKKLASNEEFQNIMAIMGLKIGKKVEPLPDGNDVVVLIDGVEYIMNENDIPV
jgi:DNA topoisomerase-2